MDARSVEIQKYDWLVAAIARRMHKRFVYAVDYDDLHQAGRIGLHSALDRVDLNDPKANAFLAKRIRGAMFDEARSHDWLTRTHRNENVNAPLVLLSIDDPDLQHLLDTASEVVHDNPQARFEHLQKVLHIQKLVKELEPEELIVYRMLRDDDAPLAAVAKVFGVSESAIGQRYAVIIKKLARRMRFAGF